MSSKETNSPSQTKIMGDFELKKKLGQGGMGVVYLGRQISLDRPCAVKILAPELAAKPGFVERFIREARSMAKIDHPHVVSCYAVGQAGDLHYVAMELIDGKSMQDWLDQLGKLSVPDALLVTILCGEALHYAHELNMIHRDIKPDNILVTRKGVPKIADMGLAKAIDDIDMSLTQSGTGMGTPHYMSPEQARNAKHVDRRSDVYALGCTLYYFLTGKTPFGGNSLIELITHKEKGQFTPAHRINNQVPERLSLMIDKAMANDPKVRYQTCADFVTDLLSFGNIPEALSFIQTEDRIAARRISPGGTALPQTGRPTSASPRTGQASARNRTPGETQRIPAATEPQLDGKWFVRMTTADGKTQAARLTTDQIVRAIKSDKLTLQTQVAQNAKGPFLPLAQVPAFETEARKMLTRAQTASRNNKVANQYDQLAKQYDRRNRWRFLNNLLSGTAGMVGLVIWLALIAAIGVGLYYGVPILYQFLANQAGLAD